jgi:hypothetical protein
MARGRTYCLGDTVDWRALVHDDQPRLPGDFELAADMIGLTRQVALAASAAPAVLMMIRLALTRVTLGSREGTGRCPSSGCLIEKRARDDCTRSVG